MPSSTKSHDFYSKSILFDELTPISLYAKLKEFFPNELSFLFESTINTESGNFSFIFIGALERVLHVNKTSLHVNEKGEKTELGNSPFPYLKKRYEELNKDFYKNLSKELNIGFVDGFIGYIGYDAVKIFEPKLSSFMDDLKDDINIPDIDLIRPKLTLAYSHKSSMLTVLSFCEEMGEKLDDILLHVKKPYSPKPIKKSKIDSSKGSFAFDKQEYCELVKSSKEMIKSGDVFQILLSNRFTQYANIDNLSFYRILRHKNPSPYAILLEYENFCIAGSSPEVMVGLKEDIITLRPIAGTRKRGNTQEKDKAMERELLSDEKERAEHLMLIDLGRNDVGRVASTGSVKVTEIMRVERYSHVMHLVSDIEAKLSSKKDMFDLFGATFTAGTMTGAPKIRAMELIAEYEKTKRSFYSGAAGYFGFDGNMDTCILIRTAYIDKEKIIFQAGGGVVADSTPELEHLEANNKLGAMMSTLEELKD
ncbi:MAG: anthranilate synthase component I family protein [Campylobacteraceae bacterium]